MASPAIKSNYGKKALHVLGLGLLSMLLSMHKIDAKEFRVGGSNGWTVPDPNTQSLNQWAERNRFQVGDSLLFVYNPKKDSVQQVKKDDYDNCNTESPIHEFDDGHTSLTFNNSGPFYFISGMKDNCLKNEKIVLVVMSDKSSKAPSASPSTPETSTTPISSESPSNGGSSMEAKFITSLGTLLCSSVLFFMFV